MEGRGIRVPFDGQRRAGGMGEPPGGEPRRWPLASFSEATCSLEGSSASRDGAECTGRALVAWGEGRPCAF